MTIKISHFTACCNLGTNIEEIYENAINGVNSKFDISETLIKEKKVCVAKIKTQLSQIENPRFNLRCNHLILQNISKLSDNIAEIKNKYSLSRIAIVVATTNSGVEEFEKQQDKCLSELGNPALFLRQELNLTGFYTTVSTACQSHS